MCVLINIVLEKNSIKMSEFISDIELKNATSNDIDIRRLTGNGLQFNVMTELSKTLTNSMFIFENNPSI